MSRPLTVAAAVLSAAVLSACGTGLQAQTYKESGRQDAATTNLNHVAVRNLHVQPPADGSALTTGSQAVLTGTFVNTGSADDSLENVTTDVASSVSLTADASPAPTVAIPTGGTSGTWTAELDGLTKDLHAGEYITVTLNFAGAGRTTLQVPVRAGDNGVGSRTPEQDPYAEG